ncbi:MAG: nitroreductase family protein [Syntrophorhabdaceae bacterium]|nr:nitroreductase family protein [Syntrophorhabdaceae bacterium]
MKKVIAFAMFCMISAFAATASATESSLPKPDMEGGKSVLAAVNSRASADRNQFPVNPISIQELSTLLWSAGGRNRDGKGWTVPVAMGKDPYCTVYVAKSDGVFRYDGKKHSLTEISKENIIPGITNQSFAVKAPIVLVFVIDGKKISEFSDPARRASFGYLLVGAMTEHVYLVADSLNIGTRYMASFNDSFVRAKLGLPSDDIPVCILPLGKR